MTRCGRFYFDGARPQCFFHLSASNLCDPLMWMRGGYQPTTDGAVAQWAGRLTNNVAAREMKRIAVGRRNGLFVGSPRGGQTAVVLFSFTATCQRLGVEPWEYLHDMLTRLPATPVGQLRGLLPDHWQSACKSKRASSPGTTAESTTPSAESASCTRSFHALSRPSILLAGPRPGQPHG
jgi:hypothetical protein